MTAKCEEPLTDRSDEEAQDYTCQAVEKGRQEIEPHYLSTAGPKGLHDADFPHSLGDDGRKGVGYQEAAQNQTQG